MRLFVRTLQLFAGFFHLFYVGFVFWGAYAPARVGKVPASGIALMAAILSLAVTLFFAGT
jgi:hypothetical protein